MCSWMLCTPPPWRRWGWIRRLQRSVISSLADELAWEQFREAPVAEPPAPVPATATRSLVSMSTASRESSPPGTPASSASVSSTASKVGDYRPSMAGENPTHTHELVSVCLLLFFCVVIPGFTYLTPLPF